MTIPLYIYITKSRLVLYVILYTMSIPFVHVLYQKSKKNKYFEQFIVLLMNDDSIRKIILHEHDQKIND